MRAVTVLKYCLKKDSNYHDGTSVYVQICRVGWGQQCAILFDTDQSVCFWQKYTDIPLPAGRRVSIFCQEHNEWSVQCWPQDRTSITALSFESDQSESGTNYDHQLQGRIELLNITNQCQGLFDRLLSHKGISGISNCFISHNRPYESIPIYEENARK